MKVLTKYNTPKIESIPIHIGLYSVLKSLSYSKIYIESLQSSEYFDLVLQPSSLFVSEGSLSFYIDDCQYIMDGRLVQNIQCSESLYRVSVGVYRISNIVSDLVYIPLIWK